MYNITTKRMRHLRRRMKMWWLDLCARRREAGMTEREFNALEYDPMFCFSPRHSEVDFRLFDKKHLQPMREQRTRDKHQTAQRIETVFARRAERVRAREVANV